MRFELRTAGRRLAVTCVVPGLMALACRAGYEVLPLAEALGGAGSSGSGAAAGSLGGALPSAGSVTGSTAAQAGEPGRADAGGPSGGEQSQGGLGQGAAGESGAAGSGVGGASNPGGCESTSDCTCETFANKSYWFCATAAMSGAAELTCETQGMTLARIDSADENAFVFAQAVSFDMLPVGGYLLIGGTDVAAEGEWRWRDGEQFWQGAANGSAVGGLYENWLDTSPTNSDIKACAGLVDTGQWQDRSCTAVAPYVCESR